jgi:hypothetical protein
MGSIGGYGGNSYGYDQWTTGDIIGVVCDPYTSQVWFYKNGVQQAAVSPMSNNSGVYLMCGGCATPE